MTAVLTAIRSRVTPHRATSRPPGPVLRMPLPNEVQAKRRDDDGGPAAREA
jgi:hypothetical protein